MAGLTPWFNALADPPSAHIVTIGDSTSWGTNTTGNLGWADVLRTKFATRFGERSSDGIHDPFRNTSLTTSTDAWTKATTSNTWDRSLANMGSYNQQGTYLGNGATKIATWTKPSTITYHEMTIWVVDGSGTGDFSYDITGLGFWAAIPTQTWNNDNSIKRIKIQGLNSPATFRIRAANSAGTATNVYLLGFEPTTGSRTSPTIHALGAPSHYTSTFNRTTSGNWHAILDVLQPQLVTFMMTNDAALLQTLGGSASGIDSAYRTGINGIADVVTGYGGSMLFMGFMEQDPSGRGSDFQQAYRDLVKSVAGNYGMPYIDFYDLVGGGYSVSNGLGYMSDGLHPSDTGAAWMAGEIWKVIGRPPVASGFRI